MAYPLAGKDFREALKEGKLLGLKCGRCGGYTVPPRAACMECYSTDLRIVELSKNGKVRTFTVIHAGPEGYQPPYIVAMVELEEGPWVTANIINVEPKQATLELIGRTGKIGYTVVPADRYSAGERVAFTLSLMG